MSPRLLRRIVWVVFVGGIGGMIVGSIKDNNGFAITFGLVTAVAALCLILVSSIAPAPAFASRDAVPGRDAVPDDESARELEERIRELVETGADEHELRVLVKRAIEIGLRTR